MTHLVMNRSTGQYFGVQALSLSEAKRKVLEGLGLGISLWEAVCFLNEHLYCDYTEI